jgi:hypothetical protein
MITESVFLRVTGRKSQYKVRFSFNVKLMSASIQGHDKVESRSMSV